MIILLDGSKGAGKTSIGEMLIERLDDIHPLSLDVERRALADQNKSRTELNAEAFEVIARKARKLLEDGHNIVVDCGLTKERVDFFEQLSRDTKAKLYKFFLTAPRETLLKRVQARDAVHGGETNVERFDEVLKITHSKDFSDFNVIETDSLTLEEVAARIMDTLD
jgi:predicted kinase